MPSLFLKDDITVVRFRYLGRECKRSLKTGVCRDAELVLAEVNRVIHQLRVGVVSVPNGIDVPDFILSGGTATAAPTPVTEPVAVPTLAEASGCTSKTWRTSV